ncbi:MAG TPA: nucleoside-diphosphate kinase [Candidatus Saccharimonadia bacterium]|nr:nucleoside-diphosphate kinase [Candidatus Saccharimonadia bacterium]
MEQTLLVIKPDAINRGLAGEVISRFERAGLKIVGMKMVVASDELLKLHYPDSLIPSVGNKTKVDWKSYGVKDNQTAEEIGQMIVSSTRDFMKISPVIAFVLEGGHAVEVVRKLVGSTGPKDSAPGTIRGDFGHQSLGRASLIKKGAANLVHASGNVTEAKNEIKLWFKPEELFSYKLVHEELTHA